MVCPPWRCSEAPLRALTPAHECDSERGTDAAAKKRVGGRGAMQRAGALLRMRRRLPLPAAPPPFRSLDVLRVSAAFPIITREL